MNNGCQSVEEKEGEEGEEEKKRKKNEDKNKYSFRLDSKSKKSRQNEAVEAEIAGKSRNDRTLPSPSLPFLPCPHHPPPSSSVGIIGTRASSKAGEINAGPFIRLARAFIYAVMF